MLSKVDASAEQQAGTWISAFGQALAAKNKAALSALFAGDCHWRNLCGLSWEIVTYSGRETICDTLLRNTADVQARDFTAAADLLVPRRATVAGCCSPRPVPPSSRRSTSSTATGRDCAA